MRLLPMLLAIGLAACASTPHETVVDRSTHVERVFQDVTAILEGMASAQRNDRVVLRGPDFRSSRPNMNRD